MALTKISSTMVDYLQSGLGSVFRSIQNKLNGRIEPEDFGAKADGIADDTAAIRRAIAACPDEGVVYFTAGKRYRVTDTITLVSKHFHCDGKAVIIFDMKDRTKDGLVMRAKTMFIGLQLNFPAPHLTGLKFEVKSDMRDALSLRCGEYPTWAEIDILMDFNQTPWPVWRDAVHVQSDTNGEWIENLHWRNIRVSGAGRDGFHFEIPGNPLWENVFINVGSFYDLEVRAAGMCEPGRCVSFVSNNTRATEKISQHNFIGGEFQQDSTATSPNPDGIAAVKTVAGAAPIELLNFIGLTLECVGNYGTGGAINVTNMDHVVIMNVLPFGFQGAPTGITGPKKNYISIGYLGLDGYEAHGEWSPTLSGSAGGTAGINYAKGTYTRVGKTVTVSFRVVTTGWNGASGQVTLGGLPFTVHSDPFAFHVGGLSIINAVTLGAGFYSTVLQANYATNTAKICKTGSGVIAGFVNVADCGAVFDLAGSLTYIID